MAVTKIELVSEDKSRLEALREMNYDSEWYPQGATYPVKRVYRLINDDGSDQYIAIELHYNSYGQEVDTVTHPRLVKPVPKTIMEYK